MQWNIIHKSVIHIWKQNFRIYIDALNINYVLRNSLVPILFSPSRYFSLLVSFSFSFSPPAACLFVCQKVCKSVRLSVCQSLCLSACLSLFSFILSLKLIFCCKIKIKTLRLMQMSKYFLFLKISKITAFAVAKESFGVVQRE